MDYIKYKRIEGYEDYIIFTTGKVFSTKTNIFLKPILFNNKIHNYKKYVVSLCIYNKKKKNVPLHRLLALAFIPNPNNLETIDHININSLDNRLSNLRWASYNKQNINRNIQKNNTTGTIGVNLRKNSYIATCKKNRKQITKSFSIKKYGADEALQLAINYRRLMVEKHYSHII